MICDNIENFYRSAASPQVIHRGTKPVTESEPSSTKSTSHSTAEVEEIAKLNERM